MCSNKFKANCKDTRRVITRSISDQSFQATEDLRSEPREAEKHEISDRRRKLRVVEVAGGAKLIGCFAMDDIQGLRSSVIFSRGDPNHHFVPYYYALG